MPAELDQTTPDIGTPVDASAEPAPAPNMGGDVVGLHDGETDREGAMAKADLYKLANYSHKLFQQIQDEDQLEGWVQAKITKAADYIASVYHYLEYEMKFSEYGHHLDNSDTLSEGQKMRLKEMLSEAKDKMKDLKKSQAEKMKSKHEHKVEEGVLTGGHETCTECGGTGMIYREAQPVPAHVQNKVDKYKTLVKATKAAHRRMDGAESEVDEEMSSTGGTITRTKTGLRHSHNPDRFSDEPHAEPASKVKARSASEKAGEKAQDKADEKESKAWGKANPGKQTIVKGGKKVDPNAPKEKDVDESLGLGMYEAKKGKKAGKDYDGDGKVESDKDEVWGSRAKAAAKSGHPFKEDAKPSAGLSKEKKSATVKKAKSGGDIGKPGKGFKALAKKAGGGEKGEKIAAAAMWKNIKETTAYIEEKKAASKKDLPGNQEKIDADHDGKIEKSDLAALRTGKKETVKESTEFNRMKELMQRLNG